MARLTPKEIREHRMALEVWQRPEKVLRRLDEEIHSRMTGEEFFNQPGIEFLRDAWAAATFAKLRGAELVRLVPKDQRWPDFEMRLGGRVEQWEVTEADIPGRRRGAEYRYDPLIPGDRALGLDHQQNYIARAERFPEAIRRASEKKAFRNYSARVSLLIYLNPSDFGTRHQQTVDSFAEATRPAKDRFKEVWILWKGQVHQVWSVSKREPGTDGQETMV